MDTPTEHSPLELPRLLDERSRPDFRAVYGRLLARSSEVDVALTRIRLSTLDLEEGEVGGLRRLRLLLARVNAVSLDAEAHALLLDGSRSRPLQMLGEQLARGVIEIRAAPLGGWSPDFSVFTGAKGPLGALLGFHWFQRPFPYRGPALATLVGPDGARRIGARFSETWARAHDISPAILGILERARLLPEGEEEAAGARPRPVAGPGR